MFKKYHSIENTYREEFLEKIKGHNFWNEEYIVQEKVHGANLSYWTTDGKTFNSAKRTCELEPTEKFYNHENILKDIKPKFELIWKELIEEYRPLNQLTIFGEVIGGDYPHKDIEPDKKSIMVQKGIFYSPKNEFFAFDIMINGEFYVDTDKAIEIFEKYKLLHPKTLFQGTLDDALKYPNYFQSTISDSLNLPPLDPNMCEGVVIKPVKNLFFNNGVRVILKNKNEKWAENKKYHKLIKKDEEVSEQVFKLQEAILTYVTENRLNNVLSKIGEISEKDFGKVMGMFSKDILEDFQKDYHKITDELEKKELKLITKSINNYVMRMVKERIQ